MTQPAPEQERSSKRGFLLLTIGGLLASVIGTVVIDVVIAANR